MVLLESIQISWKLHANSKKYCHNVLFHILPLSFSCSHIPTSSNSSFPWDALWLATVTLTSLPHQAAPSCLAKSFFFPSFNHLTFPTYLHTCFHSPTLISPAVQALFHSLLTRLSNVALVSHVIALKLVTWNHVVCTCLTSSGFLSAHCWIYLPVFDCLSVFDPCLTHGSFSLKLYFL